MDIDLDIEALLSSELSSPESGYDSPERIVNDQSNEVRDFYSSYEREIGPYLEVVEQPQHFYRFRYLTEFKDNPHGPLIGETSTKSNKTFPTVKLNNYPKKAIIRCWLCVNSNKQVHVHQLLTKNDGKGFRTEPHKIIVDTTNNFTAAFEGLNIIHAVIKGKKYLECFHKKKSHLQSGYNLNEELFHYDESSLKQEVKLMEKNKAVLFFEAFDFETNVKIDEVFSHEIKNSKNPNTSTLKISRQSLTSGKASGGTEVFIFVEKVTKDIKVQFFELDEFNQVCWQQNVDVNKEDIWHQVAIAFRTPSYRDVNIVKEKKVYFKIIRPKDESFSNEMPFHYLPECKNQPTYTVPVIGKKRRVEEPLTNISNPIVITGDDPCLPLYSNDTVLMEPSLSLGENLPLTFLQTADGLEFLDSEPWKTMDLQPGIIYGNVGALSEDILNDSATPELFADSSKTEETTDRSNDDEKEKIMYNLASLLFKYILEGSDPDFFEIINKINLNKIMMDELRNFHNKTPLLMAIETGRYDFVAPLLKAGCQGNAVDVDHNSALHLAVIHNSPVYILQLLLNVGGAATLRNYDGETALHLACRLKRELAFNVLLNETALQDKCTHSGDTPLHIAVRSGCKHIIEGLLKKGAKVYKKNNANYTPLDYAVINEDKDMVKLLLSNMKPSNKINILLVEIIMTKVQNDEIFELLEDYMETSGINTDFSDANNDEATDLCETLSTRCTLQKTIS